ncbi:BEN domain-containing protein 5-like [Ornithodoros turicata]|uniref:BEN domain-containing protein 5-like n=1 Tax=Ornithodoros turicata TaxID=34597 RepID=UPI00313A0747
MAGDDSPHITAVVGPSGTQQQRYSCSSSDTELLEGNSIPQTMIPAVEAVQPEESTLPAEPNDISERPSGHVHVDVSQHIQQMPQDVPQALLVQQTSFCPGNMMDLGNGVSIPKEKWAYLCKHQEESRFVKELAVVIWGTSTLLRKTFTGCLSNRAKAEGKTEVFPALTPEKVEAVRGAFATYLTKEKNVSREELKKKSALVRKYLSEKMSDLRRSRKQT